MKIYIYTLLALFIFSSCEEVIVIKLDGIEPLVHIKAEISNIDDSITVSIDKTVDFYDTVMPPVVEHASITLFRQSGDSVVLTEQYPGYYSAFVPNIASNELYTLQVIVEGVTYTAESYMPTSLLLDSIKSKPVDNFRRRELENAGDTMQLVYYFRDSANIENFYRLYALKNDTMIQSNYNLYSDRNFDGEYFMEDFIPSQRKFFSIGDTIVFEIQSLEYDNYLYFLQQDDVKSAEQQGNIPYNPQSNFSNGALGYFMAYTADRKNVIIK